MSKSKDSRYQISLWKKEFPQLICKSSNIFLHNLETFLDDSPGWSEYFYEKIQEYSSIVKKSKKPIYLTNIIERDGKMLLYFNQYNFAIHHKNDSLEKELFSKCQICGVNNTIGVKRYQHNGITMTLCKADKEAVKTRHQRCSYCYENAKIRILDKTKIVICDQHYEEYKTMLSIEKSQNPLQEIKTIKHEDIFCSTAMKIIESTDNPDLVSYLLVKADTMRKSYPLDVAYSIKINEFDFYTNKKIIEHIPNKERKDELFLNILPYAPTEKETLLLINEKLEQPYFKVLGWLCASYVYQDYSYLHQSIDICNTHCKEYDASLQKELILRLQDPERLKVAPFAWCNIPSHLLLY